MLYATVCTQYAPGFVPMNSRPCASIVIPTISKIEQITVEFVTNKVSTSKDNDDVLPFVSE